MRRTPALRTPAAPRRTGPLLRRTTGGIALFAAVWCTGVPRVTRAAPPPFPAPDWPLTPKWSEVETAPEPLETYRRWLAEHCDDTWAAVVIKHGYLIFEGHGGRGGVRQRNDCGSNRKSLQSTLLGVALAQRRLESLDENAILYWKDAWPTGYANDREITFRQFATFQDRWNEAAPAGTFHYNNSGATAGGACIAGLFGEARGARPGGLENAARREVMQRIGADWEFSYGDRNFTKDATNPGPKFIFHSSVYELAKLGYLWLRRGRWGQSTIFSEDYYREATTDWSPATGSTRRGFGGHYGYWWFVNRGKFLLPDAPDDAFYNLGTDDVGGGKPSRVMAQLVIPSQDLVAVLSMQRNSDPQKWDVYKDYSSPGNRGMRPWSAEVVKLQVPARDAAGNRQPSRVVP